MRKRQGSHEGAKTRRKPPTLVYFASSCLRVSPPKSVIKALWFPCDCEIVAEYSVLNGSTLDKLQRTYAWGVDIAGSLADAVGVGALLQFANSTTGTAFMPSYDGNGNIASLINLGSGALAAAFEYSPFGEGLRDEILDNSVATFAFRFSTKWRDTENGWSNYGRRYYDPKNGRFIGRDPIAEQGDEAKDVTARYLTMPSRRGKSSEWEDH